MAESYLQGIDLDRQNDPLVRSDIELRLRRGNSPFVLDPRTGEPVPDDQFIKLTPEQAASILDRFEIVDQYANDATGFSATVLKRKSDGRFSISFRSTEYKTRALGGDFERDGQPGAGGEIAFGGGFAYGQLLAMETYLVSLRDGVLSDGRTRADVGVAFSGQGSVDVTGYSLGAHLATSFTVLHQDLVGQTVTFNAAGIGAFIGLGDTAEQLRATLDLVESVLSSPVSYALRRGSIRSMSTRLELERLQLEAIKRYELDRAAGQQWNPFVPASLDSVYMDTRYRFARLASAVRYPSERPSDQTRTDGAFAKITQLYGHATHGDLQATANSGAHAPAHSIFIEGQPAIEGNGGNPPVQVLRELLGNRGGQGDFFSTHSLTLVIDSLSAIDAFMSVDGNLSQRQVESILAASSHTRAMLTAPNDTEGTVEGGSLELAIDALRLLYATDGWQLDAESGQLVRVQVGQPGWGTPFRPINGGFGDALNRQIYHLNLGSLEQAVAAKGGATIVPLVPNDAFKADGEPVANPKLVSNAGILDAALDPGPEGIPYRYALRELNAFVVLNFDYSAHNQNGALDLFNTATGEGVLTPEYLRDRAALLERKLYFGVVNLDPVGASLFGPYPVDNVHYRDNESGFEVLRSFLNDDGTREVKRERIFGADGDSAKDPATREGGAELLPGSKSDDHLYGGRGNDKLVAEGGDDYLQGDAGQDILLGEAGADVLAGGKDADTLNGGIGTDKYYFYTGGGADTVIDEAEGPVGQKRQLGEIYFGGANGDVRIVGNLTPTDPDLKHFTYTDPHNTLYRASYLGDVATVMPGKLVLWRDDDGSNVVTLTNFISGDFGIVLDPNAPQRTYTDKQGTEQPDNSFLTGPHAGSLSSDSPDQKVFGLGGADYIQVSHANAQAIGGDGNDYLTNAEGDQSLFGDAGRDVIVANAGEDRLFGGIDDDALQGGADADYLDGEDGNDVLDGGPGADVIVGGSGNDLMFGGGAVSVVIGSWDAFADGSLDWGAFDGAGNISLRGLTGVSNIEGDEGDVITGGAGRDVVFAGDGLDTVSGGEDADYLVAQADNDAMSGDDGDDFLYGDGAEGDLTAGAGFFSVFTLPHAHGDDTLRGGAGNDFVSGDGGADALYGGADDDTLIGDSSNVPEEFHGPDYLDGGDGNDVLLGYGKNDSLFGGAGDDELGGDSDTIADSLHGDDYLDGEDGNDTLHGDGGADRLFGGAGNDTLDGDASNVAFEFHGDDYLDGEDGNDALQGGGGADQLFGGAGNDSLSGDGPGVPDAFAGADYLDGEAGNDVLEGGAGDDTLIGGPSNDILRGQAGDDLYVVTTGDQQDFVDDREGSNTVRFDTATFAGITLGQITGSDGNAYLSLRYGTIDVVYVRDGLVNGSFRYEFADGSSKAAADLRTEFDLFADRFGTSAADTMEGSPLADFFFPGGGSDTIVFGAGSGFDRVSGFGQTPGAFSGLDVVRVAGGLTAAELDVRRGLGGELTLALLDSGDVLRIDNWSNSAATVHAGHQVVFDDGSGLNADDLIALALAPTDRADVLIGGTASDTIDGGAGDDWLFGNNTLDALIADGDDDVLLGGDGNDQLQGRAGDDVLDGGTGDDTLSGGTGSDTYRWGLGEGNDVVTTGGHGEGNVVELKGLTPADVTLTQGSIVITVNGTGETLTLTDWYAEFGLPSENTPFVTVEEIRFADGIVWDASLINEMANHATPFDDVLRGMFTPDVLHGLDGNDLLEGFSGDDVLAGGDGEDAIIGGAGADELTGGAGNDRLEGSGGSDVLVGGRGDDVLDGGAGHDVYVFAPGDGIDVLRGVATGGLGAESAAVIEFAAGIAPGDVDIRSDGVTLVLDYGSGMAQVPLFGAGHDAHGIGLVRFADGTQWEGGALSERIEIVPRRLIGTQTANSLFGGSSADFIDGGDGDDTLVGNGGDDFLHGGAGHDVLSGGEGNDALYGDEGIDTLGGGDGDDFLDGGAGDDQLNGGLGSDTYRFGLDTGHDTAFDALPGPFLKWTRPGDLDVILVDPGISPADVAVSRVGDSLLLETPGSSLSMTNWFASELGLGPLAVRFADGTEWDSAALALLVGYLPPSTVDNVLAGTPADDVLAGGYGNDTYLFGFGSGNDTIQEPGNTLDKALNRATAGARDTIRFDPGVTPQDVRVDFDSNRPEFHLDVTGDSLTVASWDDAAAGRVEFAEFEDGTVWDLGRFDHWPGLVTGSKRHFGAGGASTLGIHDELFIGQSANDFISDQNGHGTLYGGAGNDSISTGSGDDRLDGGAGNDSLSPGTGDNRIRFGRGFGQDTLNRSSAAENLGVETIVLGQDVAPGQVRLRRGPSSALILELAGTPDSLLINGPLRGVAGRDRLRLEFADGTLWGADQIEAHMQTVALIEGGTGSSIFTGGEGDDLFIGGEGNDTITGGGGNDTYVFWRGDGSDTINGRFPRIVFGEGIAPGDVTLTGANFAFGQRDLQVTISGNGGQLTLFNWFDQLRIDGSFEFADGTLWDAASVGARVPYAWTSGRSGFFFGTPGADAFSAGASNDTLRGHEGDDTLSGNAGNDQLFGGEGDDTLAGGAGDDTLQGEAGDDVLSGGDGNDGLGGGSGADTLLGGTGKDQLGGGAGADRLEGGVGDDLLEGGRGDDLLEGGAGDDRLYGGAGSDTYVFGSGSGRDTLLDFDGTGGDVDIVVLGEGIAAGDLVLTRRGGDILLTVAASGDSLAIRSFGRPGYGVERLLFADGSEWSGADLKALPALATATQRADVIYGTQNADVIAGLEGDDFIDAGTGDDTLDGGSGDDVLVGGAGDDVLQGGAGANHLMGGEGQDLFLTGNGFGSDSIADLGGGDTLRFGAGIAPADVRIARDVDHLYLEAGTAGRFVTLENWFAGGAAGSVEFADGTVWDGAFLKATVDALTEGDDFIVGTDAADVIATLGGLDVVFAGGGDDHVSGGTGSDTLNGEDGDDVLLGEAGYDLLSGGAGNDVLEGGADDDALFGDGIEHSLIGGDDRLSGGEGFDELSGGSGDDVLEGGADDDVLNGDAGNDLLDGGTGDDLLQGGLGGDTYVFSAGQGSDVLVDAASSGLDPNTLRLSGISPNSVSFKWFGTEFLMEIEGSTDTLLLRDSLIPHLRAIDTIEFDDGTTWGSFDMAERTIRVGTEGDDNLAIAFRGLAGLGGNDVLTGGGGADLLDGGTGDDQLRGGLGGDTYVFKFGYGSDLIVENDPNTGNLDTIVFDALPSDVTVAKAGSDVQFTLAGGDDRLTVQGWFNGSAMQIEAVRFLDGTVWDAATVTALATGQPLEDPEPGTSVTAFADTSASADPSVENVPVSLSLIADLTPGGDFFRGSGGDDVLDGLGGDDTLLGGPGNDGLRGSDGDDYLVGEAGDDTLDGGVGRDILEGGAGNDRYVFGAGYGQDWALDSGGADEVIVDSSIAPGGVVFTRDLSNLYMSAGADRLTLVDWFYRADTRIETLRFAGGTSLNEAAVRLSLQVPAASNAGDTVFASDRGETLLGLAGEDTLYGEGGDDVIDGGTGSDYMLGGKGDDTYHVDNRLDRVTEAPGEGTDTVVSSASFMLAPHVENLVLTGSAPLSATGNDGNNTVDGNAGANALRGGRGDDLLRGSTGNDAYLYDPGDGNDVIEDVDATPGNTDEVRFGQGITSGGARVRRDDQDVRLVVLGGGELRLRNWFDTASRIESVRFADGATWDEATIEFLANQPANDPPVLSRPIEDASALEDEPFVRVLPPETFADPDAADALTLAASLADGSPLPAWLAFDPDSAVFSGLPGNADVGEYVIRVTATDSASQSAADEFVLTVTNVNNAPELALPVADQSVAAGSNFALTLEAGMFTDVDVGDALAYAATRADGSALPEWLAFDAASRSFSGTPEAADVGPLDVRVMATDLAGVSASDEFRIAVLGEEPAGKHLIGTSRGDMLVGTQHDDTIEGRRGRDLLIGLAGSDVIDGGRGDDLALGGKGDDRYLFTKGGGDDLIVESGGHDVLRFGAGIERRDVTVIRNRGDVILKLKGHGGSVTVRNWFHSSSRRVERVEFADGGSWDEAELRHKAKRNTHGSWSHDRHDWERGDEKHRHDWDGRSGDGHRGRSRHEDGDASDVRALIARRLDAVVRYDFGAVADYLRGQAARSAEAKSRGQVAGQWLAVQRAVGYLEQIQEDASQGAQDGLDRDHALAHGEHGWGHASSTGRRHAYAGLQSFTGLGEGFRKLG